MHYGGSRKLQGRYRYSEDAKMGLAELSPKYTPSREEFVHQLREVVGVREVKDHHPKPPGNHYFDKNLLVFSDSAPTIGIKFGVTRNNHMINSELPFTVTVFSDRRLII